VSGSYLNPPLLGMTLNKNVLKNIGGEITDGILLNGDAQKIKVITGGEITCPPIHCDRKHLHLSRLVLRAFLKNWIIHCGPSHHETSVSTLTS
jgi:hypothetical protein